MGESSDTPLKRQYDRRVRLDFRGATITSDAGLLACRELDAALGLTETANDYIHESRTGRNVQHPLLPLHRQSVYSRLAGYEDTNDAERLAQDPAMRVIVGWQGTQLRHGRVLPQVERVRSAYRKPYGGLLPQRSGTGRLLLRPFVYGSWKVWVSCVWPFQ